MRNNFLKNVALWNRIQENRTIVNFDGSLRSDKTSAEATVGPEAILLTAGNYKVTLVSYDNHSDKPTQNQPNERYKVILKNSYGIQIAVTNSINDLLENEDWKTEIVNNNLEVSSSVSSATAFHYAYPDTSSPNSLNPICAAFNKIITPDPAIKIVKSANPTSLPFGE